jgi:CYTH domain-containing protein
MAKEIERKFLVASGEWRDAIEAEMRIRQFYLAAYQNRTIRIRIIEGGAAILTLKFSSGERGRDEFEYPVPLSEAIEMLPFAVGRVIEKTRCHVRHGGNLYEVDVFGGPLAGLVIAELETPDDVADDELPGWIGQEVTDDPRYYNASLALRDTPEAAA